MADAKSRHIPARPAVKAPAVGAAAPPRATRAKAAATAPAHGDGPAATGAPPPVVTKVNGGGDDKQEDDLREAWKQRAVETADEARLASLSHRIAADRDKWLTTALSCLSAAAAAVSGFAGITALLDKTWASLIALLSAVLIATVAVLVKSSHASDHETASRDFSTLEHDARDFAEVTAMNGSIPQAQSAYTALIAQRDKILGSVMPVPLRSAVAATTKLGQQGSPVKVSDAVSANFLNSAVSSRFSAPRFGR